LPNSIFEARRGELVSADHVGLIEVVEVVDVAAVDLIARIVAMAAAEGPVGEVVLARAGRGVRADRPDRVAAHLAQERAPRPDRTRLEAAQLELTETTQEIALGERQREVVVDVLEAPKLWEREQLLVARQWIERVEIARLVERDRQTRAHRPHDARAGQQPARRAEKVDRAPFEPRETREP